MVEPVAIGVDLGGTWIKVGVCDAAGVVHHRVRLATPADCGPEEIETALVHGVETCADYARNAGAEVAAVGVVMPGVLDPDGTRVQFVANLPALNGFALPARLSARLGRPVLFDADSNGAAWAEFRFGAGRGCDRLVLITVGTGIGVGVVVEGQLVRTSHGTAGSLGHIIVDPGGPRCACGGHGCLEQLAGLRGMQDEAARQTEAHGDGPLAAAVRSGDPVGGEPLQAALQAGDPAAEAVVRHAGRWLGVGMVSLAVMFEPERIAVGGGLGSLAGPGAALLDVARVAMRDVGAPHFTERVEVIAAELGNDAGMVGAANLALAARQ